MGLPVYNLSPWDMVAGESAGQGHLVLPRVFQVHPFSMPLSPKQEQPIKAANQTIKESVTLPSLDLLPSWFYFQTCICDHPSKLVSSTVLVIYENETQSSDV